MSVPVEQPLGDDSDGELEPLQDDPPYNFHVIRQDVELEVNFRDKRIDGRTQIVVALFDDSEEIAIDARQCEIDTENIKIEVMRAGPEGAQPDGPARKVSATYKDPYTLMDYPKYYGWTAQHYDVRKMRMRPLIKVREHDLRADARITKGCTPVDGSLKIKLQAEEPQAQEPTRGIVRKVTIRRSTLAALPTPATPQPPAQDGEVRIRGHYRITIPFSTKNVRDGLHFVGVDEGDKRYPHLYTRHSIEPGTASCIFPCVDDHGTRCDWKISIKCPRTLGDALKQPLATQQLLNGLTKGANPKGKKAELISTRDYALTEEDKLLEMTVVCSGLLTDEIVDPEDEHKKIMTFEPENKVSVQKLGFAIGPFEHVDLWSQFRTEEDDEKLGASALKVHGYCLPGRANEVRNTCAPIAFGADFFALTFSSFPFDSFKLCFVDDMVTDTVVNYSFAFISNRLLYPDGVIDTEIEVTRKIVHTLASQWSGISLIPNTRRDTWVTVGLAYFMTDLFMRKLCGNNDYRFRMKTMADKLVRVDVERSPLYDLGQYLHVGDFEMDFMTLKAPLVLFILDKRLVKASGSTGLIRIISRLFTKTKTSGRIADSIVSTESFRKICEKNGKYKLEAFWMQWIYGSGCPKFSVTQRFNKKRLCVEMTLKQDQVPPLGPTLEVVKKEEPPGLEKEDFLRLVKEAEYGVKHGNLQALFTGPMTIRIHEADGTPYEHIVEIREDNTKSAKFEIPYNTKYKRLKRNRRQRERLNAASNVDPNAENQDDVLLYCLGDVLQSQDEVTAWELRDWPADKEKQMDQESYEWIRMDSDFEWACSMKTNMQPYMYVSQLQQDRDVVAQQDTLLFLQNQETHPLVSTFLIRTLMDKRYFHGIRTMAVDLLPHHAKDRAGMIGLKHLQMAFREMFCFPNSNTPRPNDFSDKKKYIVQCAIPAAIARVRDDRGRCPLEARRFILDQLLYNDNSENIYSDHFYIAKLLGALAVSMIPEKKSEEEAAFSSFDDDDVRSEEDKKFLTEAMEEIERRRRMDQWTDSYRNIWTTAALDAKQKLMKAGVIPTKALDFVQYLQDDNHYAIRIKAFDALVDLGFLMEPVIFRLLFCCMSTDPSPYVRDKLIKVFSSGLAGLAFGEVPRSTAPPAPPIKNEDAEDDGDFMLVEEADKALESRKVMLARKRNLSSALVSLKVEIGEGHKDRVPALEEALWTAIDSEVLGCAEKITLLELCGIMFPEADSWTLRLKYPKAWKATRVGSARDIRKVSHLTSARSREPPADLPQSLVVKFTSHYRTVPRGDKRKELPEPEPVKASEPLAKRLLVNLKGSVPKANSKPTPTVTPRPSISAAVPIAIEESIVATLPKPLAERKPSVSVKPAADTPTKNPKRPRQEKGAADGEHTALPVPKRPKLDSKQSSTVSDTPPQARKSRVVTLKHRNLGQVLGMNTSSGNGIAAGSVNVRTALPSGAAGSRKAPSPALGVGTIEVSPVAAKGGSVAAAAATGLKPARKPLPSSARGDSPSEGASASASVSAPASAPAAAPTPRTALPSGGSVVGEAVNSKPAPGPATAAANAPPIRPKIVLKRPSTFGKPE
jgi:transcription initiation factor TFIID subunit 2